MNLFQLILVKNRYKHFIVLNYNRIIWGPDIVTIKINNKYINQSIENWRDKSNIGLKGIWAFEYQYNNSITINSKIFFVVINNLILFYIFFH
jgi:hypothetical protein